MNITRFRNIPFQKRDRCMICESRVGEPVIQFPDFPLTEIYVDQKVTEKVGLLDQEFHLCDRCGHGQISNIVDPEFVYMDSYETRTSTSSSATAAIDAFLKFVDGILKDRPMKTVIEIGCNDLYTLKRLKHRADKLYGIDPILKDKKVEDGKITMIGSFFENVDLEAARIEMDVVLCSHTLEHVSEPKKLIKRLVDKAGGETLFLFQFPGLESLIQDSRFDQIFHQHLNYFSLRSVIYMLQDVGAELLSFRINPYHWGTLMIAFKKKGGNSLDPYKTFASSLVQFSKDTILHHYSIFKDSMGVTSRRLRALKHERIYGYGAALMLPVLDYHLEDGLSYLLGVLDEDRSKVGKCYLNVPIRVLHPSEVEHIEDAVMVLTAINSLDAGRKIIPKLMQLNVKQIIVPLNSI